MRKRRLKTTHTQGLHAKIEWIPIPGQPFSGIYESGSDTAIIRLSEATNLTEESEGLTPSVAIKFLVDNRWSVNLFGMASFMPNEGLEAWDFFGMPLKSAVKAFDPEDQDIETKTKLKKIIEGSTTPFATAIGEAAFLNNEGQRIHRKTVNVPYEVSYTSNYHTHYTVNGNKVSWLDQLRDNIKDGDTIMEAWAWTGPPDLPGSEHVHIANIVLKTDLYTSVFGDNRLFFQHRRAHRDYRRWPAAWDDHKHDWFEKNEDTIWGKEVPQGVWPTNDEDAENFYIQ